MEISRMQIFHDKHIDLAEFTNLLSEADRSQFLRNKVSVYKTGQENLDVTAETLYNWIFAHSAGRFTMNLLVYRYDENDELSDAGRDGEITGCVYFENSNDARLFANEISKLYP
jgi:hypothetical protein